MEIQQMGKKNSQEDASQEKRGGEREREREGGGGGGGGGGVGVGGEAQSHSTLPLALYTLHSALTVTHSLSAKTSDQITVSAADRHAPSHTHSHSLTHSHITLDAASERACVRACA